MTQYRQGDVFIQKVDRMPRGLPAIKPDSRGRIVLAEGESTGHAHALPRRSLRSAGRHASGDIYLRLGEAASVTHDEHDPIALEPGAYRVFVQRTYEPQGIRNVAD